MTREEVVELAGDEDILFADGFDDCLIGTVQIFNRMLALYDRDLVIAKLARNGMSEEEAEEFFDFNIVGAYMGEKTPAFATLDKEPA